MMTWFFFFRFRINKNDVACWIEFQCDLASCLSSLGKSSFLINICNNYDLFLFLLRKQEGPPRPSWKIPHMVICARFETRTLYIANCTAADSFLTRKTFHAEILMRNYTSKRPESHSTKQNVHPPNRTLCIDGQYMKYFSCHPWETLNL